MIDLSNQSNNSQIKFSREKILAFSLIFPSLILVFITYLYPSFFTFVIIFVGKHMPCQSVHLQQTRDSFPPFWDDNLK